MSVDQKKFFELGACLLTTDGKFYGNLLSDIIQYSIFIIQ